MIETDAGLEPFEVDRLEDGLLLDLLADETSARARGDRKRLRLAVRYVDLHRIEVDPDTGDPEAGRAQAGWDEDHLMDDEPGFVDTLGGDGTPLIDVEAPVQWAAATGRSLASAKHYLANALDLQCRYPRLHARVEALAVETWRAFRVCEDTRSLSLEAARWIDERLAQRGLYGLRTIEETITSAVARFHPEQLTDPSRLTRDDWGVSLTHDPHGGPGGGNGTSVLEAIGDAMDLARFQDAVNDEATTAGRLGDSDTFGQRQAKALGTLADRQATLDLAGLLPDQHASGEDDPVGQAGPTDSCEPSAGAGSGADGRAAKSSDGTRGTSNRSSATEAGTGSGVGLVFNPEGDLVHPHTGRIVHRRRSYGKARFYVHLTGEDLTRFLTGEDATGVGDAGKLGAHTLEKLAEWLHQYGPDATISPVIDLHAQWAVDQHDPPEAMREQVQLRDQHCLFPHCTTPAHLCDLDHLEPYDPDGPPGQTNPENLGCLCRRHHLMKTHYGWSYLRNKDGTHTWTSHDGRTWLVTPFGTTRLT